MPCPRLRTRRHFGEHQAALEHVLLPRLILGRVEDVDASGDHADRAALQRAVVRGAIDAARQPRNYDTALLAEVMGESPCKAACRSGRVTCADEGDSRSVQQVEPPLGDQHRGRIVELGSHDELMARDGRYRTMFELQAQRFDVTADEEGVEYDVLQ